MTTDPAALPQWKGHAVPWVTRWTGEVNADKAAISLTRKGVYVAYEDGHETREESGILWKREGITRGGDPEFAQVNTYRQRAAMNRCRCQVCGKTITERPIRWLMGPEQMDVTPDGRTVTVSPPTCNECIPLALELCPHLRKGHAIAKVLEYRVWGVHGSVIHLVDGRPAEQTGIRIEYDRADDYKFPMTAVLARQQVVEFTKFTMEKA